ncbi:MAG: hypothetical protein QNJ37_12370 [Crocosphaera sp.]|nr:hypothetical protein [Crocosphaera sp.]
MVFIFGTPFDDKLTDLFSVDFILAGAGNDTIELINDGLEDTALGQEGDDTFLVSDRTGDNLIDGGTEINHDTVDYSSLNESITLKAQGVIEKASGGTDRLVDIERIIGDVGPGIVNTIDGSDSGSASIEVDLEANTLEVNGTGAPSPLSFKVVNFHNVRGTDNNDIIVGDKKDNVFFGSRGHDTYDGGAAGFDTVDYSDLGQQIILKAQGVVNKGSAGIDQLIGNPNPFTPSIDKIVGATGQSNLIDGRIPGSSPTSFDVDLAEETLFVSGFGTFEVVNFRDVIGTANVDVIQGDDTSNVLFGQQGNDFLRGVDETSATSGLKEIDILVGGSGFDNFVVGDFFVKDYYLSNSTIADPFGNDDFAFIFDFTLGTDQLSLSSTNPYIINFFGSGAEIYADTGVFASALDAQDDLLARVLFNAPVDLPVPPSSPKLTAAQSSLTTDELTGTGLVPTELEFREISPINETKFTTVDDVIAFAKEANAKLDGMILKDSFSSVFSSQEDLPDQLASLFAPVDTIALA